MFGDYQNSAIFHFDISIIFILFAKSLLLIDWWYFYNSVKDLRGLAKKICERQESSA